MKGKILNYLFLTLLIINSIFLISRVVWTRLPQTPETIIVIFLFFSLFRKGLAFSITWLVENKNKYLKKKKTNDQDAQNSLSRRISLFFKTYQENVEKFLIVDFTRKFLANYRPFSIFFFACANFYQLLIIRRSFLFFFPGVLTFFPWLLPNLIFLYEASNRTIYYTFYGLAFIFLFNRFLKLLFFLIENTLQMMANITLSTYLKEFFEDPKALMFLVNNQDIRSFFFSSSRPELQTKTIIIGTWQIFRYVMYSLRIRRALQTFQFEMEFLKKYLLNLKIIIWFMVLVLVWIPGGDLFIVFVVFLSVFLIFVLFLDFLEKLQVREETIFQFKEIMNNEKLTSDFFKKGLVFKYGLVLNLDDLPDNFFKDPKIWDEEKRILQKYGYNPYYLFGKTDQVIWEQGVAEIYAWYRTKNDLGIIDHENFEIKETKHD